MKKVNLLFLVGWVLIMLGIYLSTHWTIIGMILGIFGGLVMGGSSYFLPKSKKR
ncbi:hypothetical protein [Aquibacillus kalidii]|uniref:hypothetical protein n=1 Tax=Aquibacillus kalidii TaxID=2762597 RepID=UPI00164884CE|nr:hypothetical protein [Aquibacillus kalidii]